MDTITTSKVETVEADTAKIGKAGVARLARLREIAAIEKAARDVANEKKELTASLLTDFPGAKHLTFQGVVVATRIDSKSTGIDRKKLAERFPEAYEATYTESPYSYFRIA